MLMAALKTLKAGIYDFPEETNVTKKTGQKRSLVLPKPWLHSGLNIYPDKKMMNEKAVQNNELIKISRLGGVAWRNNSGVAVDASGNYVRFGLANTSDTVNKNLKSSDLIGIMPVVVTPDMVGQIVGVFYAREVKRPNWKYTGTSKEKAQKNFIDLINLMGGDAAFTTGD
jgi:hypothetical protein